MKRERNARKDLNDLYLYFDIGSDLCHFQNISNEKKDRFYEIKDRFDKKYGDRRGYPYEWSEYYGLFKTKSKRVAVDPVRMQKMLKCFSDKQLQVMNRRNTTYFHPEKRHRNDYFSNCFVDELDDIIKCFKEAYKPIIDKSVENIKKIKELYPGDYINLQCGISGPMSAQMWANIQNMENERKVEYKKYELYTSQYAQFFHYMASRIEAKTVELYSRIHPDMKDWSRDKLYDNINTKNESSRNLKSFKYHDELYLIWNFLKHNNLSTYEKLKERYPNVLLDCEYKSGDLAIRYLILNEKIIMNLLKGTKQFFIEWCELNLNEKYSEAHWNFDDYFTRLVKDEIEVFTNPLGLEWYDID